MTSLKPLWLPDLYLYCISFDINNICNYVHINYCNIRVLKVFLLLSINLILYYNCYFLDNKDIFSAYLLFIYVI